MINFAQNLYIMITYLQVEEISKSIGDLILFENIKFSVHKDQKVALIAQNGTGKSTLLDILAGIQGADNGEVIYRNDVKIGYLSQNPPLTESNTVIEEVLDSPESIVSTVKEYELAINSDNQDEIQALLEKMDTLNAWDYEARVKSILTKLKITDFNKSIGTLSGGQKKRVALAKVLVEEPDFLILDEPTNHLDLEMIEWLEEYLSKTKSTLLMVTHDRYFLDRVCNEIIEMADNQIYSYKGNYSYYLEKREERVQNQQANIEKAQNLMKTELEWMRRMPKARGGKAKYRIDSFHTLKEKANQRIEDRQIDINIKSSRLGNKIIEINNISKSFGDLKLINDFTYNFARFEKVGLVGKNGAGKSTFLNLITGSLDTDTGSVDVGETIRFGYYKQDGISFNDNDKVIDAVREIAEVVTMGNGTTLGVSQFLNYFLFPSEKQHTLISKLSGGERRRLYLVTVLMQNPNFLILDEPTNDLDIHTLNVLEDYLQSFSGCVIIVSHDRYFMDKIVDHLFVFEGNGVVKDFPGNYTILRDYQNQQQEEEKKTEKTEKKVEVKPKSDYSKRFSYKEKLEFEQLEKDLETLEEDKNKLEAEISTGTLSSDDLIQKSQRVGEIIDLLDEKMDRWLELSEKA